MPTTKEEAGQIVSISQEYINLDKMTELFVRLDEEVGKKTTNQSLQDSLKMMRGLVDPPRQAMPILYWFAFYILIVFHYLVVVAVGTAFFILPFYANWYIAIPLMTFVFFFATTRVDCQLTNLENVMRKRLGMRKINGFVGHYFLKPIKKAIFKKVNN